ncbi:GNAT family N-acetyltransferase [Hymenobacter sp. 15J16-1T3B]|uniref:GNAT family N-acetyltransferase n=1 Tax=Hymenobacter sp. 15J16-1T3B TaxID=2886941 RepID=UPI001D1204F2|nr:GNAT family N-acetyltransferase [Hymenobacter sp. 15J16-1T3B]MCC3156635.1 GNAT family N-acetyltransferase [Hymenobacter sp. 15J16-1T3B]
MSHPLTLVASHPAAPQARPLLDELSAQLGARFGGDGRDSFQDWADGERYIFLLAKRGDEAVGCGAVRPLTDSVGEVKRMYAKRPGQGIGRAVLAGLEASARAVGYAELWLETRVANTEACRFYEQQGYQRIDNYGKYAGRDNAVCFGKRLGETNDTANSATTDPQQLVQEYIDAYNRFDVAGMLRPLHPDVVFRNVAGGEVTLTTNGQNAFRQQAEQATQYFTQREQRVTDWRVAAGRVEINIDYNAVLAVELPNGLKPGDALQLQGRSVFGIFDGLIRSIDDIS